MKELLSCIPQLTHLSKVFRRCKAKRWPAEPLRSGCVGKHQRLLAVMVLPKLTKWCTLAYHHTTQWLLWWMKPPGFWMNSKQKNSSSWPWDTYVPMCGCISLVCKPRGMFQEGGVSYWCLSCITCGIWGSTHTSFALTPEVPNFCPPNLLLGWLVA